MEKMLLDSKVFNKVFDISIIYTKARRSYMENIQF